MVWSARLPWDPISIAVPCSLGNGGPKTNPTIGQNMPPGLIACLTADGYVRLAYLGTNPTRKSPVKVTERTQSDDKHCSPKLIQTETETEELNKTITLLTQDGADLKLLPPGDSKPVCKVEMKTKLRADSQSGENAYFIDVLILFQGVSDSSEFDSIFLTVDSCSPLSVEPNYVKFPLIKTSTTESQCCSLSVGLKKMEMSTSIQFVLDLTVRLTLVYTGRNNTPILTERTKFVETFVKLPLHWFYAARLSKKSHACGSYRITFDLAPELVAYEMRLHKILSGLCPPDFTGSTLCIHPRMDLITHEESHDPKQTGDVFLLENLKKSQLRLQSDYPEMFGPIINELLHEIRAFCQRSGLVKTTGCLLQLHLSKSADVSSSAETRTPDAVLSSLVIRSFRDYLFASLCEHLESRLALATQVAANAVQARHFRALQTHVLNRIQEPISTSMTGFDTLLEASLHQLIQGCQSAMSYASKQFNLGFTVVAMLSLLILIFRECVQPLRKEKSERDPLFQTLSPGVLLTLVAANESVEVSRGQDVLPETKEDLSFPSDSGVFVGLEEYLDLAVGSLLIQMKNEDFIERKPISTALIPDVNGLMQRILCLLKSTLQ
ncbi:unnamed protein product [Echinostoma caproni]|uniref:PHTB1_C domain-containing protein n=1 Tax=Echinostoma caproni TaxID=27848 RepID=A0A183AU00_9TREM|nr:unnamed protein product [Echinostoma caproni]